MRCILFFHHLRTVSFLSMIRHLFCVVLVASTWSCVLLNAQENKGIEVVESTHPVQWEEESAPVGHWGVRGGFWLDEIPWGVFETSWPGDWESGQSLTESASWVEIPEASLTSRQRHLLTAGLPAGEWSTSAPVDAAQWKGPLLRWNSSKQVFERLMEVSGAFGRGWAGATNSAGNRTREWPDEHPLSESTSLRLSISKSGLYSIDRAWMIDAGFDPDTIDPRKVQLFGNGGALLPMDNSEERPLGLRAVAVDFSGSEDGSWDDGDALVFGAKGPIGLVGIRASPSGNTYATRTRTKRGISWSLIKNLTKDAFPRPQWFLEHRIPFTPAIRTCNSTSRNWKAPIDQGASGLANHSDPSTSGHSPSLPLILLLKRRRFPGDLSPSPLGCKARFR